MGRLFTKEKLKNCCLSLLLAALVAAAGGCGGGSDGTARAKLYVAGELHGGLADALSSLAYCAPYGGQTDAPLLISYEDGEGIDDQTADDARRVFEAGYAVGIEHATADEVNEFLEAMGLEPNFVMPESGESEDGAQLPAYDYVEFFGIKSIDGDVLSYTTLAVEEPELVNKEPETIYISVPKDELDELKEVICETPSSEDIKDVTSGDICVEVDADKYLEIAGNPEPTAEDLEEMEALQSKLTQYGWELHKNDDGTFTVVNKDSRDKVTSADLSDEGIEIPDFVAGDVIYEETVTAEDEAEFNRMSAESIIWWLFATDVQAGEIAAEKQAVANSLNAANSTGGDLKQVMNMYQKTYDASAYNQVFKIFVDAYACRAYNSAPKEASGSGSNSDWFFIKQYAQLNPSGNYANEKHNGTTAAHIKGYMVYYSFDNWLVDSSGNEVTSNVVLHKPKPDSTVGSTTEGQSSSFSFGGNIGFSGLAGSGGLNFGGSFSYDQSTTVPDCQVDNQSMASGKDAHATWLYSFSRPQTTGHPCIGCNDFKDAPTSARSMFQPENQWTWELSNDTARNAVKGFKFKFKWQNGYSNGEGFAWWIKVASIQHVDWVSRETTFYVPFDAIMPPLIAANDLEFNAAGAFQTMRIGTCNRWTASSDSSWCHINNTSGTPSDGGSSIRVTVDPNTTGADRTAYITLSTTNAAKNESIKVEVFQSRY